MELDDIDLKIIETLRHHGRWGTQTISKKTGIPVTTVYHRIKKLEKEGVIKEYTITIDHELLGTPVLAYILIKGDLNYVREGKTTVMEILTTLKKKEYVEEISSTTGHYDYLVKIRAKSMKHLSAIIVETIRHLPGVSS